MSTAGKQNSRLAILGYVVVVLIHGSAIAGAYYFLFLGVLGSGGMIAVSIAKPLAVGVASLAFVVGAVVFYRIIVQGLIPRRRSTYPLGSNRR